MMLVPFALALFCNASPIEVRAQPTGTILGFGGAVEPSGFLWANGQAVDRTFFAALFAQIGTTYGAGDGTTTFNVPDFRGRFPMMVASSGTGSSLGSSGGTMDHVHSVDPPNTTSGAPSGNVAATILAGSAASPTHTHDVNISAFNSASANPPFIVINFIIKY